MKLYRIVNMQTGYPDEATKSVRYREQNNSVKEVLVQ
jgi:hypothetical protein